MPQSVNIVTWGVTSKEPEDQAHVKQTPSKMLEGMSKKILHQGPPYTTGKTTLVSDDS